MNISFKNPLQRTRRTGPRSARHVDPRSPPSLNVRSAPTPSPRPGPSALVVYSTTRARMRFHSNNGFTPKLGYLLWMDEMPPQGSSSNWTLQLATAYRIQYTDIGFSCRPFQRGERSADAPQTEHSDDTLTSKLKNNHQCRNQKRCPDTFSFFIYIHIHQPEEAKADSGFHRKSLLKANESWCHHESSSKQRNSIGCLLDTLFLSLSAHWSSVLTAAFGELDIAAIGRKKTTCFFFLVFCFFTKKKDKVLSFSSYM